MVRFGPAKILHLDASIYCEGHGRLETVLGKVSIDAQEYKARATLDVTTPIDVLKSIKDPYAETQIPIQGTVHLIIAADDGAFRFEGDASTESGGFMVMRANELCQLECRQAMSLAGTGTMKARAVQGEVVCKIIGFDPAGYPELDVTFTEDGAAQG